MPEMLQHVGPRGSATDAFEAHVDVPEKDGVLRKSMSQGLFDGRIRE